MGHILCLVISSRDLLRRTKIGNAKTLTRWHRQGLIPEPIIGTHPNGRGKMAYWQDSVLERCRKILALKNEGHSLVAISTMLDMEKSDEFQAKLEAGIKLGERLNTQVVKLSDNRKVTLEEFLLSTIYSHVKRQLPAGDLLDTLAERIRKADLLKLMLLKFQQGYHPCLAFNAREIKLVLDVQISILMSETGENSAPLILVPLGPVLRHAYQLLGEQYPFKVIYFATPRVIREEKGELIEYGVLTMGGRFKLNTRDARTYGSDPGIEIVGVKADE